MLDGPAFQGLAEILREHLHVPGQDHEVDHPVINDAQQSLFAVHLGLRRKRDVMKGDVVVLNKVFIVEVVGDDSDDVDRRGADAHAEEQVVQAVAELGDHQQDALTLQGCAQCEGHVQCCRDPREVALQSGKLVSPSKQENLTRRKKRPVS